MADRCSLSPRRRAISAPLTGVSTGQYQLPPVIKIGWSGPLAARSGQIPKLIVRVGLCYSLNANDQGAVGVSLGCPGNISRLRTAHSLIPLSLPVRHSDVRSRGRSCLRPGKLPQQADQRGQLATGNSLAELHPSIAAAAVPALAQRHPRHPRDAITCIDHRDAIGFPRLARPRLDLKAIVVARPGHQELQTAPNAEQSMPAPGIKQVDPLRSQAPAGTGNPQLIGDRCYRARHAPTLCAHLLPILLPIQQTAADRPGQEWNASRGSSQDWLALDVALEPSLQQP